MNFRNFIQTPALNESTSTFALFFDIAQQKKYKLQYKKYIKESGGTIREETKSVLEGTIGKDKISIIKDMISTLNNGSYIV